MEKVILESSVLSLLRSLDQHLELCDEHGRTVGYFLPPELHHEVIYAWAKSRFTDEELKQAREGLKAEGGLTTAEAVAYLESLTR